ncbi:MAG TPA: hypothetical protein VMV91_08335 [Rhodocyclaceae bacterium]|nr:hypothetical protein [Rhodocyclaceae bacterium]
MSTPPSRDAKAVAAGWRTRLAQAAAGVPADLPVPEGEAVLIEALAQFAAASALAGQTLLVVVPDDELLPPLSNALDLALRPLCLVLPQPGFAARIALRATLSLLNSRLARGGENSFAPAWRAQRARLEARAAAWAAALDWCAGNDASPPPVGELFPLCVLPLAQAESLSGGERDVLLIVNPERMAAAVPLLLNRGRTILLLRARADAAAGQALVLQDEDARLFAERELLGQQLSELELEFATAQAELAEFTQLYYERVGERLVELDRLQARIAWLLADRAPDDAPAQHRARESRAQAERSGQEHHRFTGRGGTEKPFAPSGDVKRLFRHLAQKIHPDRAEDEADRAWRTELMSEANRAYKNGDEMVLRGILAQWQEGAAAPAARGTSGFARQVAQMQRRLSEIEAELKRLLASRLYEFFVAAKLAQARGRDLLQELADKLDREIGAARLRQDELEAL